MVVDIFKRFCYLREFNRSNRQGFSFEAVSASLPVAAGRGAIEGNFRVGRRWTSFGGWLAAGGCRSAFALRVHRVTVAGATE
jgi:hypothetical protein